MISRPTELPWLSGQSTWSDPEPSPPLTRPVRAVCDPVPAARTMLACFGVACPGRGQCARYAAVDQSAVDQDTLATCRSGIHFPLFMKRIEATRAEAA